jgi:hypothetical protein
VTDLEGVEHAVEAMPNWTVMEIIRDGDLPMRRNAAAPAPAPPAMSMSPRNG